MGERMGAPARRRGGASVMVVMRVVVGPIH